MPRSTTSERGSNLVEAALVVPLLLLLLPALLIWAGRISLTSPCSMLPVRAPVSRWTILRMRPASSAAAQSEAQDNGFVTIPAAAVSVQPANPSPGNPVTVIVQVDYNPLLGAVLGVGSFPFGLRQLFGCDEMRGVNHAAMAARV